MMNRSPAAVILLLLLCLPLASSFAAKKAGGKKKVTSAPKGFGAPPATWQEAAAKCKNRMPRTEVPCPCGTGNVYEQCCAPYHKGDAYPESILPLLRSRYSAFCFRDIKYVIDTTHPICADWREDKMAWVKDLNKGGMFDNHDFVDLDAGPEECVSETEGFITFKLKMVGHERSAFEGKEHIITERSKFLKGEDGRWVYATGEVDIA